MSYFEIDYTGDFVHLSFSKPFVISLSIARELLAALAAACRTHNCSLLLVDGPAPSGDLSAGELYQIGLGLAEMARPGLRVAICLDGESREAKRGFFKDVTANRGASVQFFQSRNEALNWLVC